MANIQGTPGSNQLTGTFLDDQIYGLAGRDFLYGLNGNDYLYGGADDDSLNGGDGRDYLQGDGGADILFGGLGTDTAVFNGNYSDYLITKIGNNPTTVQDLNGLNGVEGVDTVWFDVERIQFNDKVVFLVPNQAPVAADNTATTDEDTSVIVSSVLANDTDGDLDPLSVSAVNGSAGAVGSTIALASGALVTMQANGTYVYDPNDAFEYLSAGQTAQDSFTYTVSDGFGGFDDATVTVTIQGVNDFSVLNFDDIPVTNGGSAAIPAGYQGFNWTNAQLFDPANDNPIRVLTAAGLGFTPDSGENIVRSTGSPLEIRQSDGSNFDFISAFFSSATDNNQITITAYDDSNAVKGTFTFEVDEGSLFIGSLFPPAPPDVDNNFPRTIDLSSVAGFTDVDKVTITGTATFGFDDFAFNA